MAEVAPAGGGGGANRNFIFIVGGLAALLALGLIALGAFLILPGLFGGNRTPVAATTVTPTRVSILATSTPAAAATSTLVVSGQAATNTPSAGEPTSTLVAFVTATSGAPTATPIGGGVGAPATATSPSGTGKGGVGGGGTTPAAVGTLTKGGQPEETPTSTPETGGSLPSSGLGEDLLLLGGGLLLIVIIFFARYARTST